MHRASERNPSEGEEGTKNHGKHDFGDGVIPLAPVYWQETAVSHSTWKSCHGRSVIGGTRDKFMVRSQNEV